MCSSDLGQMALHARPIDQRRPQADHLDAARAMLGQQPLFGGQFLRRIHRMCRPGGLAAAQVNETPTSGGDCRLSQGLGQCEDISHQRCRAALLVCVSGQMHDHILARAEAAAMVAGTETEITVEVFDRKGTLIGAAGEV